MTKRVKDQLNKFIWGQTAVPRGLFELSQYFLHNEPINFRYEQGENGNIVAVSSNFRHGSIITSGTTAEELDRNIKDAILTSFEVPSSYALEAGIHKLGDKTESYALA